MLNEWCTKILEECQDHIIFSSIMLMYSFYKFSSHLISNSRNRLYHVGRIPKSYGIGYMVDANKGHPSFRTQRNKHRSSSQVLSSSLQLLKTPFLLFKVAVAGANMMKNFSFKHKRHIFLYTNIFDRLIDQNTDVDNECFRLCWS